MNFSEELQNLKESSGMTNKQIAEHLGVPLRTFEDWKSGRRTPADYVIKSVLDKFERMLNMKYYIVDKNGNVCGESENKEKLENYMKDVFTPEQIESEELEIISE